MSIHRQALCLSDLILWIYLSLPLYNNKGFDLGHTWMIRGFPYFFQFKSEFGNKEFMIWATVSSWSCFCWLYRASPSRLQRIQSIWFRCWPSGDGHVSSCVVGRGCLLWPARLLAKLLAFALHHFVLQGQTCLLLQGSLDFLLCIPIPYDENDIFFGGVSSGRSCSSSCCCYCC